MPYLNIPYTEKSFNNNNNNNNNSNNNNNNKSVEGVASYKFKNGRR